MKKDFPIEDEWLPYEIHPDTPSKGVFLKDYFPNLDPEAFLKNLNSMGSFYNITFNRQPLLSNSAKALLAGEFAKETGKFDVFHEEVFKAYFVDSKDIGSEDVIFDITEKSGLERSGLKKALDENRYSKVLKKTTELAGKNFVTAAPTFFIGDNPPITGAQSINVFRDALMKKGVKNDSFEIL